MFSIEIKSFTPTEGLKSSHRKDKGFDKAYVAIDRNGASIVEVRTYWPANDVYACLWVHYDGIYASGSGRAGGYGYDKRSAAVDSAFRAAGIDCTHFHGTGMERLAVEALGRYLAQDDFLTVVECNDLDEE